ncbi:MAG: hypothetical protein H0X39_00495 [Actinobacteria bacterium]|nr:hypothetical protein [Actinomycetota bacterium]
MTELDGALGVLPASSGKIYCVVGASSSGPFNLPSTFGRPKDVISNFGGGPLVEAACHELELYGKPVCVTRTAQTVAGTPGTIDVTGVLGTSVATLTGVPIDDYEAQVKVLTGGTIGTAGIILQWSLDGGRTLSPPTALGTATSFAVPGAGSLAFAFAAGTLIAGDVAKTRTTAPQWNATDLGLALDALGNSAVSWELVYPVGPIDGAAFDLIETKIASLRARGKFRAWIGNTRVPLVAESEATYAAALVTIFGSRATVSGSLCAGAAKITSSVSGRKYKRPIAFSVAAVTALVSAEINIADVNRGPLIGVTIRDANGNPDEHDESVSPGLDDARFCVLRTWEGRGGAYVNRPLVFSNPGSDFSIFPYRRVINIAEAVVQNYLQLRLNKPILVSALTGFILESEALEIEAGAKSALRSALLAVPMASSINFVLSRTDNLLSSKTLTGDARIVPLAYAETINVTVGYTNPAAQILGA